MREARGILGGVLCPICRQIGPARNLSRGHLTLTGSGDFGVGDLGVAVMAGDVVDGRIPHRKGRLGGLARLHVVPVERFAGQVLDEAAGQAGLVSALLLGGDAGPLVLGAGEHELGGIWARVHHEVVADLLHGGIQFGIIQELLAVDDTHVHARLRNGMPQENRVNGLSDHVHSSEAERQIGNTTADLHIRAEFLDLLGGLDEIHTVVVVLLHPSADCQHVGVEDDVFWWELHLVHEDVVAALADAHLVLLSGGLAVLIERHDDHGGTVLAQQGGVLLEKLLTDLQRDTVHDGLALAPLQTSHNDVKLGCIQHEWHLRDLRLGDGDLDELLHGSHAVKHTVIDVDVDHVSAILDLGLCDVHGGTVVASHHQLLELDGPSDVAPLSNVEEWKTQMVVDIVHHQILQTGQPHLRAAHVWKWAGLVPSVGDHLLQGRNVFRGATAAATHQVDPLVLHEHFVVLGQVGRCVVITTHDVGQTGVGVHQREAFGDLRHTLKERNHLLSSQSAVQTHAHGLSMAHTGVEGLSSLSGQRTSALVHQSSGDEHGHVNTRELQVLANGVQGSLGVQGVEDSLHHQDISTSIHKSDRLFEIGLHKLVERHVTG
mmetsp:Transcript_64885/g.107619  ORF Transcript_64885/g.107619 Transcript_64885/m.107619 type:complete len:602 (+) Transcript_64885:1368-3173(+)